MPKQATPAEPVYVLRRVTTSGTRLYAAVVVGKSLCASRVVWVLQKRFATRGAADKMSAILAHVDPALVPDVIAVRLKLKAER